MNVFAATFLFIYIYIYIYIYMPPNPLTILLQAPSDLGALILEARHMAWVQILTQLLKG